MKKFLKGLFGVAFIGAAAAGAYYWLTNDKYSDFDDFDEDDDVSNDDLQDFLDKEVKNSEDKDEENKDAENKDDDRYVTLDFSKDKVSEDDKIIGDVADDDSKVVKADSDDSGEVEGFSFADLT